MAFGAKQLKNPTPTKLIWRVRVFSALAGVVLLWIPTASYIPHDIQDICTSLLGLAIALSNAVLPFFGVDTDQATVPIKDVGSMDESKQPYSAPGDAELNK